MFLLPNRKFSLTNCLTDAIVAIWKFHMESLLFRVVEVHRTCEATATPETEGANLSE